MKRILLALSIAVLSSPAAADACSDLWFTRNLVMDRAGYCFASALGKAVFDNAGCKGKSVTLSRADQKLVEEIRKAEKVLNCKVDTSQRTLDLPDVRYRWALRDLPVADEFESGCMGWQAAPTPLYAGRDINSPVVTRILPGDDVGWGHWAVGDWQFVTVHRGGWGKVKGAGWLIDPTDNSTCRQWAG